jgi:hypothetical protein
VGGLEAMSGVSRAQLAGLHYEGNQTGGQGQEEKRVTEAKSKIQYSHYDLTRPLADGVGDQNHAGALDSFENQSEIWTALIFRKT